MLLRLRRSIALKLILASALPSALVLLAGLFMLVRHSQEVSLRDPALAYAQLRFGAVVGTLLSLTFAAVAIGLGARYFLVKPMEHLTRVMRRAEEGEFLVRAKVESVDELGRLAGSFNTMLARVTDMAVHQIETQQSIEQLEREMGLQNELRALNQKLAAHVGETDLLLEVSNAIAGTLDLPEQLAELGRQVCARLRVAEFSVMLVDDLTHQLVVEAVSGDVPTASRGTRFSVGEGITGEMLARGEAIYVPDVELDPRYLHYQGQRRRGGSFLSVPLRAKGKLLGAMNFSRTEKSAFSPGEIRLAEALSAQASLAISNARLYAQTLELSNTDPLTGIANRRQLYVRLEQELSRSLRFGDELSVLMVDLDLFKSVNDAFGHSTGDSVLRGVALTLLRNVRKVDLVARYGGEEFCVVLPRITKLEALEVAEKLRRAVASAPLAGPNGQPSLRQTISLGVASFGVDATDLAQLIEKADAALYEAKREGRNRVHQACPDSLEAGSTG